MKRNERWLRIWVSVLMLASLTGCRKGMDKTTTLPRANSPEYLNRPVASATLFPSDEAVLGGASIEQILASKVLVPTNARLVVLPFGGRPAWNSWSEDLDNAERDLEAGALFKLRSSARLAEVSLLPALMAPQKQTIPYLREAGARVQADLLLVYRSTSQAYERSHVFSPDKVKSKCLVEVILLDVRTGIVPFSACSVQTYQSHRTRTDFDLSETLAKAELKALSLGLEAVAGDLVDFLKNAPVR